MLFDGDEENDDRVDDNGEAAFDDGDDDDNDDGDGDGDDDDDGDGDDDGDVVNMPNDKLKRCAGSRATIPRSQNWWLGVLLTRTRTRTSRTLTT